MVDKLTHDLPLSEGQANILKRADLFVNYRWTPVKNYPRCVRTVPETPIEMLPKSIFEAWRPQHGLPYSSVRYEEKFIGINVSLETFYTALMNPESVVYSRDLTAKGKRMAGWYGTVCSAFVSYALDLPFRRSCKVWGTFEDMPEVKNARPEDVRICDAIVNDRHATLLTDIVRDEKGCPVLFTITECTTPQMTRQVYNRDEFQKHWLDNYKVYRYTNMDSVPAPDDDPYNRVCGPLDEPPYYNKTLLPDYGNRANYRLGEKVVFNVMQEGWKTLRVLDAAGQTVSEVSTEGKAGLFECLPEKGGFYSAHCERSGQVSDSVEFCMTDFTVTTEKKGEGTVLHFNTEDVLLDCVISRASDRYSICDHGFSDEEKASRSWLVKDVPAGDYEIKVIARNTFGRYSSSNIFITL